MKSLGLILLLALAAGRPLVAAGPDDPAKASVPYPLQYCIVSGEHLEAGQIVPYVHHEPGQPDRLLRFCCRKCLARFKADPARYLKKLDETVAKTEKKK
jgi:hypothetical protein